MLNISADNCTIPKQTVFECHSGAVCCRFSQSAHSSVGPVQPSHGPSCAPYLLRVVGVR